MTASGTDSLLNKAIALHKNGDLAGAVRGYEKVVKQAPQHAGALNLLGLAYFQNGDGAKAVSLLKQALALRPDLPGASFNLASVLQALHRHDEAVSYFERALAVDPRDVLAHFNLALVLIALQKPTAARAHLEKAATLRPDHAGARLRLADLFLVDQDFKNAELHYRAALAREPRLVEAHCGLAAALIGQNRFDEAIKVAEQAIALAPDNAGAYCQLGVALQDSKRFSEAIECYRKAIVLDPNYAEAYFNLANSLYAMHQYDAACGYFRQALGFEKLRPEIAIKAELTLGWGLQILGRYREADRVFDKIIAEHGDDPHGREGNQSKGIMYLGLGKFAEGWPLYEYRYGAELLNIREDLRPRWHGEAIAGTLWVWAEQGLGDQILHAGMIDDLRARASSILLEVEPRLVDLFARSFPGVRVVAHDTDLSREQIQAQTASSNLGRYLRASWNAFPKRERGYLMADPARAAELRARLAGDGRKIVGVSWRSTNPQKGPFKSAQLIDFSSLFLTPGMRFVDLQYGETGEERAAVERAMGVTVERLDDIDNTRDLDGLAALMTACDAVVTVSNTNAHLAGALGRPTWVFVPFGLAQLWYWFKDYKKSPWYANVRVVHQSDGQSWENLIALTGPEIGQSLAGPESS